LGTSRHNMSYRSFHQDDSGLEPLWALLHKLLQTVYSFRLTLLCCGSAALAELATPIVIFYLRPDTNILLANNIITRYLWRAFMTISTSTWISKALCVIFTVFAVHSLFSYGFGEYVLQYKSPVTYDNADLHSGQFLKLRLRS